MHLGETNSKGRPLCNEARAEDPPPIMYPTISWYPSHTEIPGNEREDHLAEEAATLPTTAEPMITYNLVRETVDISWTIPWKNAM